MREAVEEGLGEVFDAQKKLDEVYAAYAEPDADFDTLAAEQAELEAILATSDGGNAEQQLEIAADALRLPPWDAKIEHLSGGEKRRVALCRLLLSKARHAAARRTDQPPGRRIGRLARTVPARASRAPSSRSPTIATSSTTPPSGFSNSTAATAFRGRATTAAGSTRRKSA